MTTAAGTAGPDWKTDPRPRIELVDAIRGLALFGILQVNIQSFTWGLGDVLGYLDRPPNPGESALYFLQSAFIAGKFYPIFAFLFGFGMALQVRKLRRRGGLDARQARSVYRRRLAFLLALGIAHGVLLYFGDVLLAYAICGFVFLHWTLRPQPVRPAALVRIAWIGAVASLLALALPVVIDALPDALAGPVAGAGAEADETSDALADAILGAHLTYTQGGFREQLEQRLDDELWQQTDGILSFWPQVLALYALGALAGRLGWLRRPERHALLWRRAAQIGWAVGLPCALAGAALELAAARSTPGWPSPWADLVSGAGSLLAAAYVALAVGLLRRDGARRLRAWLACAGRASLSNYLLQSLAMGALLSGWGLGWGASASRAQLAALALGIFAAQVAASRWWLSRFRQGPVEALWRRWTYGR
jgi:uncharacterized protein